jgi:hypothetical protein
MLRGGPWEMAVRPERGGRITSLRLRGEELLEQGIGVDDPAAEDFVAGGAQGWDEMVPNLEAVGSLPDHGEAWRVPWVVEEESGSASLMSCRGRVVPFEFRRRVSLGERVRVDYGYTNVGTKPHLSYWCAHPLFRFERGMEIGVPDGERLAQLSPGRSTKVFFPAGSIDRVRLGWSSGSTLEIAWDVTLTPDVAVWVCNGDLLGYRQIAIEPATSSTVLGPGEALEWWLEVRDCGVGDGP